MGCYRAAALALAALLLLAQTPHARKARGKPKSSPAPAAPGAKGVPGSKNPLAVPVLEVNVPREPPKGWRDALYADDGSEWITLNGGVRPPKELTLPADPPGHPNALVAFLASVSFMDNYFEKLPVHIVVDGARRRKQICNIAEGQLLVREFHLGQPRSRADVERPCVDRRAHLCSSGLVGTNNVQFAFGALDQTRPDGAPADDWPVRCQSHSPGVLSVEILL